jgi:hypothetical protein
VTATGRDFPTLLHPGYSAGVFSLAPSHRDSFSLLFTCSTKQWGWGGVPVRRVETSGSGGSVLACSASAGRRRVDSDPHPSPIRPALLSNTDWHQDADSRAARVFGPAAAARESIISFSWSGFGLSRAPFDELHSSCCMPWSRFNLSLSGPKKIPCSPISVSQANLNVTVANLAKAQAACHSLLYSSGR